ncbi:hypothetical protein ACFPH6_38855, partial [Streptomyces xiangluensis]
MSNRARPELRRTLEGWLARARTKDRYEFYDLTAAKARLMRRRDLRRRFVCAVHGGDTAETTPVVTDPPTWTTPGRPSAADDVGRAGLDLRAVSLLLLLSPHADSDMAAFIDRHFAHRAGARTFACLLHLSGHADGARFWWQFAAGAGDDAAEYCLF